jgi:tRNA (cmo5U34)-methyltransferase
VGPSDPRWQLTGVDPSADMLALARAGVGASGLADRVRLVRGTLDDLPAEEHFDAATAIFVLMHLPDDGSKLDLLRGIAARLRPGVPFLLVDATRDHHARFAPAWQRYAEAPGMPAAQLAALVARLTASTNATTEARELALLGDAGFHEVTRFLAAFMINGWIATRRPANAASDTEGTGAACGPGGTSRSSRGRPREDAVRRGTTWKISEKSPRSLASHGLRTGSGL